jgi:hypothetical protein
MSLVKYLGMTENGTQYTPSQELVREVGDYEIVVHDKKSHWLGFKVYKVLGKTENGISQVGWLFRYNHR